MKKEFQKSNWRRLDNTAKIFPVITNENLSNVFRISVTLTSLINPDVLQQALEEILPEIHNFRVKLRRGIFWYYFEENHKIPQVQRESTYPCRYIDPHGNRKFLFRVTYFGNRINLEVYHALTDGLGAVNFLKELTYRYLQLMKGVGEVYQSSHQEFPVDDSYLDNYREIKHQPYSSQPAYRLDGNYLPFGSGQVLHGYVNIKELKAVCKKYDVSITKYLAASLIWSIWQTYLDGEACDQPIVLNLPINLRAMFESETMANFFAVTMIGALIKDPTMSFATLVGKTSRQIERKIEKDRLEESISYNVSNEKKWYLRAIPLFVKTLALRMIFRIKDRAYTMTLSNIGPIKVAKEFKDDIKQFHLMIGVSRRQPLKCAVCAYEEDVVITFTSVFADSRLQHCFFKKLKEDGASIRLEGNELSAVKKREMYPRVRKVLVLRRGGEAKASRMVKQVGNTGGHMAKNVRDYMNGNRDWKEELNRRFHV